MHIVYSNYSSMVLLKIKLQSIVGTKVKSLIMNELIYWKNIAMNYIHTYWSFVILVLVGP